MEEVTLVIQGQVFKMKKDTLCEYSDYFRAMFSGHYVEKDKDNICIDVLDPEIVKIIIQYMNIGLINLYEYSLSTIRDIAVVANFLQIIELIKQIEYTLELKLCERNWVEIMEIADYCMFTKLEHTAGVLGLLSFKSMKVEYIPTINKLAWYLSNPYLYVENELDVFKFGYEWIINKEMGGDALLIFLSCLDLAKLSVSDIKEVLEIIKEHVNSLAIKVVQCLYVLHTKYEGISNTNLQINREDLIEEFTLRVWTETYNILNASKPRKLVYSEVFSMWQSKGPHEAWPQCFYTYNTDGLKEWMAVTHKCLWGWGIATWGLTKLIFVCGEYDRGTGKFMTDVNVYDTMQQSWSTHGVHLPKRRHAGLAVLDDSLYIIGGVGSYRVCLNTAIIYDLKHRSYRKIAKLADAIQSPAVCTHRGQVYVALQSHIYRHEETDEGDDWVKLVPTPFRLSYIRSFRDYIYGIQGHFSHLYRFRPGVDNKMQLVTQFSNLPTIISNLGNRLFIFTRLRMNFDHIYVEEYIEKGEDSPKSSESHNNECSENEETSYPDATSKPIYDKDLSKTNIGLRVNDIAGSGVIVTSMPPLIKDISDYQHRYLSQYSVMNDAEMKLGT